MLKRKFEESSSGNSKRKDYKQKHSLDSDEEDIEEENVLDERDIEGEEEGNTKSVEGQYMTAFNMREEMEEGHFDKDGHFIWKNEKEIRDNWLDNIDWQKVASVDKYKLSDDIKGLGDESSDEELEKPFNENESYKTLLSYLKEKETVTKALNRLGGETKKLSSIERLKRKKEGTLASSKEVVELTELANEILSKTGNMNIYQETYESVQNRIQLLEGKNKGTMKKDSMLDMYSDDFDTKEQQQLQESSTSTSTSKNSNDVMWEFKWKNDDEKTEGPFPTSQMAKWANDGYFKTGVLVRKWKENSNFHTSNRIDFELYM